MQGSSFVRAAPSGGTGGKGYARIDLDEYIREKKAAGGTFSGENSQRIQQAQAGAAFKRINLDAYIAEKRSRQRNAPKRFDLDAYIASKRYGSTGAESIIGYHAKETGSGMPLQRKQRGLPSFERKEDNEQERRVHGGGGGSFGNIEQTGAAYGTQDAVQKKLTAADYENQISGLDREIRDLEAVLEEANGIQARITELSRNPYGWKEANNPMSEAYSQLQAVLGEYQDMKALKSAISEKKASRNRAKYLQEGLILAEAANNEDFGKYSGYVSTEEDNWWGKLWSQYNMGYEDLAYEYINNRDGIRETIQKRDNFSVPGHGYEDKGYGHLNEDEVSLYNYYYAKEGKKKAQEYLDSIQEQLNRRMAEEKFGELQGKTGKELLYGAEAGLDQFESGVKNLFNFKDDYIPYSTAQITSQMVREDLADDSIPFWYNFKEKQWEDTVLGNSLGQVGYDLINTTSNMAPSILTSVAVGMLNPVAGEVVGTALMGGSAAGNAYQEMLNLGYDKGQARAYSTMVGASEASLSYLLGGIGKLGGKVSGKAVEKLVSKIDNGIAKAAIRLGGNMLSEGAEEAVQTVLEPVLRAVVTGESFAGVDLEEVIYSGLLGALSAGFIEGGGRNAKAELQVKDNGGSGAAGLRLLKSAQPAADAPLSLRGRSPWQSASSKAIDFRGTYDERGASGGTDSSLQAENDPEVSNRNANLQAQRINTEPSADTQAAGRGGGVEAYAKLLREVMAGTGSDVTGANGQGISVNSGGTPLGGYTSSGLSGHLLLPGEGNTAVSNSGTDVQVRQSDAGKFGVEQYGELLHQAGLDWDTAGQLNGAALQVSSNSVANRSVAAPSLTTAQSGRMKAAGAQQRAVAADAEGYAQRLQEVMPGVADAGAGELQMVKKSTVEKTYSGKLLGKTIAKSRNNAILIERGLAMSLRKPKFHILTDEEIQSIIDDANAIGIDTSVLRFNQGKQTGYVDGKKIINIRGDILPDLEGTMSRDRMSQKAVLAHEYYGHFMNDPSPYPIGDWRDEFQASYNAAVKTPNLSDEDRRDLMVDAYDRAREAGAFNGYDELARRIIYGF